MARFGRGRPIVGTRIALHGVSQAMNSPGDMHPKTVLMLLTNAYDPDPRVRQEALALVSTRNTIASNSRRSGGQRGEELLYWEYSAFSASELWQPSHQKNLKLMPAGGDGK